MPSLQDMIEEEEGMSSQELTKENIARVQLFFLLVQCRSYTARFKASAVDTCVILT